MSLRDEDRRLQIELTTLQIKHNYIVAYLIGISAAVFSAMLTTTIFLTGLRAQPENLMLRAGLTGAILIAISLFAYFLYMYTQSLKKLRDEIEKLKRNYRF